VRFRRTALRDEGLPGPGTDDAVHQEGQISVAMASWKARTLASVLGPNMPSTASNVAGRPDRLRKLSWSCTAFTAKPAPDGDDDFQPGGLVDHPVGHQTVGALIGDHRRLGTRSEDPVRGQDGAVGVEQILQRPDRFAPRPLAQHRPRLQTEVWATDATAADGEGAAYTGMG
jgi:hypothetical protein